MSLRTCSFHLALVLAAGGILATVGAGTLLAGTLNPPAGPVLATMKPLTDVEPRIAINSTNTPGVGTSIYRITQPGSYYLTGNITGAVGRHGIEIMVSDVTIDLNGFELIGIPGSLDGVTVPTSSLKCIAVKNGAVRSWGQDGVDLLSNGPTSAQIHDVRAVGNGQTGLRVRDAGQITRCTSSGNASHGIETGDGCTISDCSSFGNGHNGFSCSYASMLSGCTAMNNGITGVLAGDGSTVSKCSAYNNSGGGFLAAGACTVAACAATHNAALGIQAYSGSRIVDCSSSENGGDGIQCTSICIVSGNSCDENGTGAGGGAGIHATGSDNRIEGNNCVGATRGVLVDSAGNFIVRNTCSGNILNWVFVAGNVFGPIVDRISPGSGAVSGNSAASSLGSTDSNANFSY